jgi:hypothetical protein
MTIASNQQITLAQPLQGGSITSATAQASTSGTSIEFTGIPSWAKRITVMFNGVSTNGTGNVLIQLGSGSYSTSGYKSTASYGTGTNTFLAATIGFITDAVGTATVGDARNGLYVFCLIGSNTWVGSGTIGGDQTLQVSVNCAGSSPALSGALDRLRIIGSVTGSPSDTFDAGSINILYEG